MAPESQPTRRAAISRLGGLQRSAMYDGLTVTERARSTFRDSFLDGHACAHCPPVEIPADLPAAERERRAAVLRKLHYTRIATLPRGRKTRKAAADVEPATADATEVSSDDLAA